MARASFRSAYKTTLAGAQPHGLLPIAGCRYHPGFRTKPPRVLESGNKSNANPAYAAMMAVLPGLQATGLPMIFARSRALTKVAGFAVTEITSNS